MNRLIYLSPVPLNSPAQRPHHFVRWYQERFDAEVLWVDPYPTRLPQWQDWQRLVRTGQAADLGPDWMRAPWLQLLQPRLLPLEPWDWGRRLQQRGYDRALAAVRGWLGPRTLVATGKPSELASRLARELPAERLLYDVMDFMHGFSQGVSSRWMQRQHAELLALAGICWVSSTSIQREVQRQTERAITLVHNAASQPRAAGHATPVSTGTAARPVYGYIGTIAPWLDWAQLAALARAQPQARVELVGPLHTRVPDLPANVQLLPAIRQETVYERMRGFDAGLIPFLSNPLTEGVDPIKYYEYRACGLPVLSTRFGEMRSRGAMDGVWFLEDEPLEQLSGRLVRWRAQLQAPDAFLARHGWQQRFDAVARTLPDAR